MTTEFKWPCHKRTAHGPHIIEEGTKYEKSCPGVKVHPATQIGGNYQETKPEVKVGRGGRGGTLTGGAEIP